MTEDSFSLLLVPVLGGRKYTRQENLPYSQGHPGITYVDQAGLKQ